MREFSRGRPTKSEGRRNELGGPSRSDSRSPQLRFQELIRERSFLRRIHRIAVLGVLSLLSACSSLSSRNDDVSVRGGEAGPEAKAAAAADLNDTGSDLDAIPLEVNKMVLQWIDYFQGRGRPHMERYLSRSTRYMPVMKTILREEGLPEDLIYIALIESGFSSTAHSSANAVGYWQFIRGTGRRYNLEINSYVDERRDFVKATYAAAQYFKGLYNLFGAWYLAIASYNVGENRVKSLVMKYHTRDFWQLARENKLPNETINYVPKFLAARLIAKAPEKYGFVDIEYMPPLEFDEVEIGHSIDIRKLAQAMNLEYDDLRDLNPSYKRGVAFAKSGALSLRIPKGMQAVALAAAPEAMAGSPRAYLAVADEDYTYYRVRRGDTLSGLARKFGTSLSNLRRLNNLSKNAILAAGRRIRVPAERFVSDRKDQISSRSTNRNVAASKKEASTMARLARQSRRVHIVKKGDTLIEIARKYQVSLRELANHNQIRRRSTIPIGARLEIP